MAKHNPGDPIIIKKYANRRLYDTSTSSYVTLEHLAKLIQNGKDFVVQDAKSGDDLTRSVLAQIIFEEENKGTSLLPVNFLRQIISFYGDQMQSVLPAYLDMSMNAFASQQEKFRENLRAVGGFTPMAMFEEMARRNMAMFEQTMGAFQPPGTRAKGSEAKDEATADGEKEAAPADSLNLLQEQMRMMQDQLDKLAKSGGKS